MKSNVLATMILMLISGPTWAQQISTGDTRPTIAVYGSAVVNVKPDKVVLTFGIETEDRDIIVAKEKNHAILKRAMESMKELEIPSKEIATDHLSVHPQYINTSKYADGTKISGFMVRNVFTVTLSETSRVESLVAKLIQDGVNHVHDIDFQTSEFKKHREQARELALKAAREKATKMAAVLDQSVGIPIQISDQSRDDSRYRYYSSWSWGGYDRGPSMAQNVVQNIAASGDDDVTDSVALGKIAISAAVYVTFELKDEK